MGHLAWTCQNATGNRGDDIRALKLCELQPHEWLHPDTQTGVKCILGCQGEEKAGKKGLKTVRSLRLKEIYNYLADNLHRK